MSRVPLGKVLLRNVIRHTDAHNKIQEETEMWKIREMEKQTEETYGAKRRRTSPDINKWDHNGYKELYPEEFKDKRGRMRSDGLDAQVSQEHVKSGADTAVTLRQDASSIRAWNKKYSECEAGIPDRWGHSGYKELYPEEFDTDCVEEKTPKRKTNGQEKARGRDQKEQESHKRKRSKKTHKKKQKKRSHKKLKKRKKERDESTETSSDSDSSNDSEEKQKKSKSKKKMRKKAQRKKPSSSGQDSDSSSDEMSSTEDAESEEHKSRQTKRHRRKNHHRSKPKDVNKEQRKSRRTNWKVAKDEGSDSSDEDD